MSRLLSLLSGSGGTIDPITLSPRLWLDAKDASTLIISGGRLDQWSDKSGNSNNATQIGALRPDVSTKFGLPGVTPNNAVSIMNLPDNTLPAGNQSYTIIAAVNPNALNNSGGVIISDGGATSQNQRLFFVVDGAGFTGTVRDGWWANNLEGPSISVHEVEIFGTEYTSGGFRNNFDNTNTNVSTDFPGIRSSQLTNNTIMGGAQGAQFDAYFHELFVFDYVLTAEQRGALLNYLNLRWIPEPFNPLSTNPRLWLDAKDPSTFVEISGRLSQWLDKSGNSRHVTQSLAPDRAIVGSKLGLPCVERFDANSAMDLVDDSLPSGNSPYTVILVVNSNFSSENQAILGDGNSTTQDNRLYFLFNNGVFETSWWFNSLLNPSVSVDTVEILGSEFSAQGFNDRFHFDKNHATVATDAPGSRNSQSTGQRLFNVQNTNGFDGVIHEIFVWNRILEPLERFLIIEYLKERWVPTSPPPPALTVDSNLISVDNTNISGDATVV